MCKAIFVMSLVICSLVWQANAQTEGLSSLAASEVNNINKVSDIGVGFQVGSYSGINLEYWLTQNQTANASLGFAYGNTAVGLDYVWLFRDTFTNQLRDFVPYVGFGAVGVFGNNADYLDRNLARKPSENFGFLVHVPVGIQYLPRMQRFGLFAELAPSLEIVPNNFGLLTGDVGARFYF